MEGQLDISAAVGGHVSSGNIVLYELGVPGLVDCAWDSYSTEVLRG